MRYLLFAVLLVSTFVGCTTAPAEEAQKDDKIEALKAQIMASHDTTMAEMNTMGKLRTKLKKMKADTTAAEADTIAYQETYIALMRANKDMMDWMSQFENPDEMLVSEEEKIDYLKAQRAKMKAIEQETFAAIKKAQALIEK